MKDKTTAALFALFLGGLGVHRFYLKQPGLGILYIILSVTTISFLIGFIDFIVLLAMDPEEFDRRYNDEPEEYDRYKANRAEQTDYKRRARSTRRSRSTQPPPRRRSTPEYRRRQSPHRAARNSAPAARKKVNPFKQSGINKYKDFDLEAAIEDFVKGLEITPDDISLHFNIACAYSLTEQKEKAFDHLDKAVMYGFKDLDKIKNHDDLAYVRIQKEFDQFAENGFRLKKKALQLDVPKEDLLSDDLLLSQLKRLADLKQKGLITEKEYEIEKSKLAT